MPSRLTKRLKEWALRTAMVIVALMLGLVLIELGMTIAGKKKGIDFGNDTLYYGDRDFRNGMRPGLFHEYGGTERINSHGTRGPEFDHIDYLALGDSCTFQPPLKEEEIYPGLLASPTVQSVNAGTPGYNTDQGLWWLKKSRLLDMHPKLVSLYYGWNDHWRAAAPQSVFRFLRHAAAHSRLATFLARYEESIWREKPPMSRYRWFTLVSLGAFKSNLKEMIRLSRAAGATVVLITAPSERRLINPEEKWFTTHGIEEFDDHAKYIEAVREVARETGAGLVDFAAEIDRQRTDAPADFFFDFVHPNAKGNQVLASLLKPWVECAMSGRCPPAK
jgi:lysophospholipase L1-like esterase